MLENSLPSFNKSLQRVNSVTVGRKDAFVLHKNIKSHNIAYCYISGYTTFQITEKGFFEISVNMILRISPCFKIWQVLCQSKFCKAGIDRLLVNSKKMFTWKAMVLLNQVYVIWINL